MLRKLSIIFVLFFLSSRIFALEAIVGHSIFYLPDPIYAGKMNPYLEAYWQMNPKTVHFKTIPEKGIVARIQTDVFVTNDTGGLIKEDHYVYQTKPCTTVDELNDMNILELKRYFITPGFIKMKVILTDLNDTSKKFTRIDTFTVPKAGREPFYGGPELVDTFYESDTRSPFRKHGYQYIPLCEGFYDSYRSSLNYYSELYQLENIAKSEYPLIQSIFISRKENQNPFDNLVKIDTILEADAKNMSGKFNISNLPSGNYYLNFSLGTKAHKTIATKAIFFQRYNTNQIKAPQATTRAKNDTLLDNINVLDLGKTFVAKYDMAHLKAILKMLLPVVDAVSTQAIKSLLKSPDDLYVRYFIYNHFLALNKEKPEKAWKEYSEEVKEVNKLFSAHGTLGYETDKGFMYLRYGAPSETLIANGEKNTLPYEIWQYNTLKDRTGKLMSNGLILFYKTSETDFDYRVLHSNISGELHNSVWRSFLYTASSSEDYSNTKAELMFGNR